MILTLTGPRSQWGEVGGGASAALYEWGTVRAGLSWKGGVCVWGGTWHGAGLCGRPEGEHAGVRLALLVLGHHVDLVLRVPVQAAQHHVLAVVRDADLRLPVAAVLLREEGGWGGLRV